MSPCGNPTHVANTFGMTGDLTGVTVYCQTCEYERMAQKLTEALAAANRFSKLLDQAIAERNQYRDQVREARELLLTVDETPKGWYIRKNDFLKRTSIGGGK